MEYDYTNYVVAVMAVAWFFGVRWLLRDMDAE
jgi:hypothetical protein